MSKTEVVCAYRNATNPWQSYPGIPSILMVSPLVRLAAVAAWISSVVLYIGCFHVEPIKALRLARFLKSCVLRAIWCFSGCRWPCFCDAAWHLRSLVNAILNAVLVHWRRGCGCS